MSCYVIICASEHPPGAGTTPSSSHKSLTPLMPSSTQVFPSFSVIYTNRYRHRSESTPSALAMLCCCEPQYCPMSRRRKPLVMPLRPYQRLALYHLRRCLEAGVRCLYVELPTGTGKSTIAAAFAAQRLGQTQGRVLVLVHRQDLALQLAETLSQ